MIAQLLCNVAVWEHDFAFKSNHDMAHAAGYPDSSVLVEVGRISDREKLPLF